MSTITPLQHRQARAEKRAVRQHADASRPRFNHRGVGVADLGCSLRDRHPEIFAKPERVKARPPWRPIAYRPEPPRPSAMPPARHRGTGQMVKALIAMAFAPLMGGRR